ncbi:hypothetical protein D9613_010647 [Agrocybe pediades]|uniref:Polyketide synthase-like phosphopantetheine-binding domain-containing protein n=1 Tax=Agrocybe pediades TaxID=84607 RepID=A0A8H4QFU8_9AGAR|nr:hypothetical protein D9613_010647 [Agrocybe pediades]
MDSSIAPPPADCSVTIPESLDYHTRLHPYEPIFIFSEDGKPEPTNVSYLEFGRAVDRVAHYLRPGREGEGGKVIAFVALSDVLLYQAITLGIVRAGHIPYPMSPRNTAAAIVKLMHDTSSHRLITTCETLKTLIDEIKSTFATSDPSYDVSVEEVPPLSAIFPKLGEERLEDPFEQYPRGERPALDDVMWYLHSSGSTGMPKTIPQTFRSAVHWASFPPITDIRDYRPRLIMAGMALPPFHTLGIIVQLFVSLYSMVPITLYPPTAVTPKSLPMMPTPANILDHMVRTKSNSLVIIPALLQIWAQDPKAVEILANLEFACYSGGNVPSKLGNFMTQAGVYLSPVYGATEFGAVTYLIRKEEDKDDWEYMKFGESINIRWDPQGDGTYECQFVKTDVHHVSVENLPDTKGYATSDLWMPHPTKPYFWKIVGRKDDVIVHTSGEKTVPAPMEDVLMSSPYIMGTVMFGREHDQAGVLIELKPAHAIDPRNKEDLIAMRNTLWPIVEEANKVAPAFSRIFKEMILISSPDKPLPRAGKGTIMRKAALAVYNQEIEDIYAEVAATASTDTVAPPESWMEEAVVAWIKAQVKEILSGNEMSTTDDLFEKGMDSLGATILRRRIVAAIQTSDNVQKTRSAQLVTQTTVYSHSTPARLAAFVAGVVADPENFAMAADRVDAIENMVAKYTAGLGKPVEGGVSQRVPETQVVLLTGSTGNLGSQILASLLMNGRVGRVYTLDRPPASGVGALSVEERQARRFSDRGLDTSLLRDPKLVRLMAEMSHKHLGLAQETYEELCNSVTTIIHNAWKLDFNLSLTSFESNIQGTRNLVDLARESAFNSSIKVLFTSSISAAYSWDTTNGAYPEEVVLDAKYAVGNGYGESKYVSERILAESGVQATSFRIGQITGGQPNGAWAVTDWVPILLKSSIRLGAFPAAVGLSSWLPSHAVSQAILDVALASSSSSGATHNLALNIVHPAPIQWNTTISLLNEVLVKEGVLPAHLPSVDFERWIGLLEEKASGTSEGDLSDIPAIKLLDFFRGTAYKDKALQLERGLLVNDVEVGGLATFSTDKIRAVSETMRYLPSLGQNDADMWVKYWKGVGFI